MSFDPSKTPNDNFFEVAPANVQVVVEPDGSRKIIETKTIAQPNVISYSTTPGQTVYTTDARAIAPTTSYVTYSGTGGVIAQPRASSATFQNVINQQAPVSTQQYVVSSSQSGFAPAQGRVVSTAGGEGFFGGVTTVNQPSTIRYETTTVQQPTYVTTTETRTVQPVQVQQVTTKTVEQPVQVIKTVTTTTESRPQAGFAASNQINTYEQNTPLLQGEKYADQGYNFYDGDVEDVHTEAPVSAGPATCGLVSGLLALLASLALVGLMGAIWHRTGAGCFSAIPLSHLIMACIAVAAAAFGIWVCLSSRKAIAAGQEVNHTLVSIALLLALIFFAYFLASAVYMYMYRPFHYADLSNQRCGNNSQWNKSFNANRSFDSGWGEDRRILWWVALLSLVAAVGFLILAICLWLLTKFTAQSARLVLGAACLAGVILACFGITYFLQARSMFNNNYSMKDFNFSYLTTLMGLLGIGGIILFLNAIWNLFKKRTGHFVFGILLIIFVFVFVCFLGLMLRSFRETHFNLLQKAGSGSCRDILANFDAACFKDYCPGGKYLPAGTGCSKEFYAFNWEDPNGGLRYINPCCCNSFTSAIFCPLMYASIMGLLFIMAVIIAIAANFYLSDTSEYLEFTDKKFGIFELLFVIGCVLCLIAFGFYWGFRPADKICRQNPNTPAINRDQFGNIVSFNDPNFKAVDLNKVYNGAVPPSAYIQGAVRYTDPSVPVTLAQQAFDLSTANNIVTLNGKTDGCGSLNCGWRMGVLVTNGKIVNNFGSDITGASTARTLFFDDKNSNDDFVLLKGSQADVQKAISQLKFNAIDINKPTQVFFNGRQVDLLALNSKGLQPGEVIPDQVALDPAGTSFAGNNAYTVQGNNAGASCLVDNSCQSTLICGDLNAAISDCKAGFQFYSSNGSIDVNVPLQVRDINGNYVADNGQGLISNSYFVHQNTQYKVNDAVFDNGNLKFKIPRPLSGSVNLILNLNDSANRYLPYSRYSIIPADAVSPYNLDAIQLLTKSGAGCAGSADPVACFANQQAKSGTVKIALKDQESGAKLAGVPVKLLSGIDGIRSLSTNNTDANGVATFNNVVYDYYTVQFEGNGQYLPSKALLAVQDAASSSYTLNLHQRGSGNTILQQFVSNKNADQDFSLNIQSTNGYNCNVSPYNKYCGYASHVNDVEDSSQGYENIRIHNFTEANYLAYLQNNAASPATCGVYEPGQFTYYGQGLDQAGVRSLSFDWNNVRKAQVAAPLYQTLYCFNGWGLNTIRYFKSSSNDLKTANICNQFWPAGSEFALAKLAEANAKK